VPDRRTRQREVGSSGDFVSLIRVLQREIRADCGIRARCAGPRFAPV